MRVLGISAFYHDSAAALVRDGTIVAAAQEERFTRKKYDARFPTHAIEFCLKQDGVGLRDVDIVVLHDKPFLKFERMLETYLAFAPRGFRSFRAGIPAWIGEKLFQRAFVRRQLEGLGKGVDWKGELLFAEHHLSHAASAFFPSPFETALVLTMDGVGEWATTSAGIGRQNDLTILKEVHFPHSLGLLYSAFTSYAGFKVNSGEYKLMGLAPYGRPEYVRRILDTLIDVKPDGSFRLNLSYFDYCTGLTMTNPRFHKLFGASPRTPGEPLTQFHRNLAASIQAVLDEVVLRMVRSLVRETGLENLCLAGGVALNCITNAKLLRDGCVQRMWIQPASGDAGGALGAALAAYHLYASRERHILPTDAMRGSLLGPEYDQADVESRLRSVGARFLVLDRDSLIRRCAEAIESGATLGWFQGRMEFGPRALGCRSILGDPRSPKLRSVLNDTIKYREAFRPFAPSVLWEHASEWFDLPCASPYMMVVAAVTRSSEIPAVTHIDDSARVQTIHIETNPLFHELISEFYRRAACPLVVNTSFNVRGEPIVCTPEEAFACFMGTGLDFLAVGDCFLTKTEQTSPVGRNHRHTFEPD